MAQDDKGARGSTGSTKNNVNSQSTPTLEQRRQTDTGNASGAENATVIRAGQNGESGDNGDKTRIKPLPRANLGIDPFTGKPIQNFFDKSSETDTGANPPEGDLDIFNESGKSDQAELSVNTLSDNTPSDDISGSLPDDTPDAGLNTGGKSISRSNERSSGTGSNNSSNNTSEPEFNIDDYTQRVSSKGQGLLESQRLVLKNRFVLEKTLGTGGMGVVYKAKDLRKVEAKDRNPYVAVKILNEDFRKYPDAFIALQREARKSQSIAHPNIVNVHDFDRDGDTVFMTMEYMEGKPLDKLIQENRSTGLPPRLAIAILRGMCAALQHAHAENIIHSDFKPGNVFVTRNGTIKVFDFGIARAVAIVDRHLHRNENTAFNMHALSQGDRTILHNDKSLFDPETFGALTPAYASLEMLLGQPPSFQDDVYALAVVTYEMLAGEHPFERLNAEEALARKLKPKKLRVIKRQQWKALKKALAFNREDRTLSISQFLKEFTQIKKTVWKIPVAMAASAAIATGVIFQFYNQAPMSTEEIRAQLEYQIKTDMLKDNINSFINEALFDEDWHKDLLKAVYSGRNMMVGPEADWLKDTEANIVAMYIERIRRALSGGLLDTTKRLLAEARKFHGDRKALETQVAAYEKALQEYREEKNLAEQRRKEQQLAEQRRAEERKLAGLKQQEEQKVKKAAEKPKVAKVTKPEPQAAPDPRDVYKLARENVYQQLRCKNDINERDLGSAVRQLQKTDSTRFNRESPRIVSSLVSCIEKIGAKNADRAMDLKSFALGLFPQNKVLAKLKIAPVDPCSQNMAGLGVRSQGTCRDRLFSGGYGPRMVVIPHESNMKPYAISQFEITVSQFNDFCKAAKQCDSVNARDPDLPVTNIPFDLATSYTKWLSQVTGYSYRIPKEKEWIHAAKAKSSQLDENRNCTMNSRGINRGEQLEIATAGQKNNWGLVNYVGNAQEWALSNNRFLVALGGAHTDPFNQCDITTKRNHSGKPDNVTGFRVVRLVR